MAPAIEDDAGDVALGVKVGGRKHLRELIADAAFVLTEGSGEKFSATTVALGLGRKARIGEKDFYGEDCGRVGTELRRDVADERYAAEFDVVADVSAEPATSGNAKFCEEAPIAHGDVGHDAWRAEKLRVGGALSGWKVGDDAFAGPTAAGHHGGTGTDAKKLAVFFVNNLQ